MRRFPAPIQQAMSALGRLPGVGPKTALRYAFALLRLPKHEIDMVARAIAGLKEVRTCSICFMHTEHETCEFCLDARRSTEALCVVAESRDIATMEATGAYHGKYFVLGGVLNPIDGQTPETLHVRALETHIQARPEIKEIILAFSPDVHGETTILFLSRMVKSLGRKSTRLARGLPMGADIEYADEVTLGDAFIGRRET
jgi:recombination protein RecR